MQVPTHTGTLPRTRVARRNVGRTITIILFLLPALVLNNQSLWTLPMGVMKYSGEHGVEWGPILAFVTLALVPVVGFYLLAQQQLIAGLTAGAVKG